MTSANAPTRLYIPQPFADGTDNHATVADTSGDALNFVDGFPNAYSASNENGGKFVTRKEINALGYLATANEFQRACGGIITFDGYLAKQIGGYPKYAVLEFLNGSDYNRVISLVENNMVDFTGKTTDETLLSGDNPVVNGSVDGTNWAYLGNGTIAYLETLCEIGDIPATTRESHIPIGGFCAPRNGIPYFEGDLSFVDPDWTGSETITGSPICCFYLFEGTNDPTSLDGVSISGELPEGVTMTCIYSNFDNTGDNVAKLKAITAGKYYSLWADVQFCGVKTTDFKLKLA